MINVKDQVYGSVKDVTENVGDEYPKHWGTLPAVQLTEEDNSVVEWVDGKESKAHLLYRFDIWHNQSTSQMAVAIDAKVSQLGLKRIACGDVADPSGLKHKVMRYEGIIDVETEMVFNN